MGKTHVDSGVRKILELPAIYNFFGKITGGQKRRSNQVKKHFNLKPGSKVLDIGCGSGALLNYLPDGIEYHGFDMQKEYIEYARKKFGSRGNFYLQRVGEELKPDWEGTFDAINADGILHHLSDEDCKKLFETALYYLKEGGYMITIDTLKHKDQSKLERWLVSQDRGQNVKFPEGFVNLVKPYFKKVETEILSGFLIIPYSAFRMKLIK